MRRMILSLLPLTTAALAAERPPADPERTICRREAVIGSLVPTAKLCLTPAEWAKRNAELDDPHHAQDQHPF